MSRRLFQRILCLAFLCLATSPAWAISFDVTNVAVSAQADDAVKARDIALTKAQRLAFGTLVGRTEDKLTNVSDIQLARLVRGFSVQGEKVSGHSYSAKFTIRFNPNATQMFIQSNGFDLVEQTQQSGPVVANVTQMTSTTQTPAAEANPTVPAPATAPVAQNIVVLPVLDIGTRKTLWDEPNPWREIWQKNDYSQKGLSLRVPLGDVSDVTDVPDSQFLSGGKANISDMLTRYSANILYVVVARHQTDGMLLSLYRDDGNKLQFIRKNMVQSRAGYAFNDAVPAAVQMIIMAQNNKTAGSDVNDKPEEDLQAAAPVAPQTDMNTVLPITAGMPFMVTVPYQSLPQWVGIQKRLRLVPSIKMMMPLRVSPSSAQVRLITATSDSNALQKDLALQGFDIQQMPNGEIALTEK